MLLTVAPIWKEAPFIRLLVPLMSGILLQWHGQHNLQLILIISIVLFCLLLVSFFLRGYLLYKQKWLLGTLVMLCTLSLGMLITHCSNIQNRQSWFENIYKDSSVVIASVTEPLVEKNKSYKATAQVYAIGDTHGIHYTSGSIIIYFSKDSSLLNQLSFGSTVLFRKKLQPINNSGNPGAFDYRRYCLFQGITHQVYLTPGEFTLSPTSLQPAYLHWLQASREKILRILKSYIPGRKEAGVAEALLIGYRNDLDRDLLQQYANTGVIHVIAISGMHLAMIYGLLIILLRPLQKNNRSKWVRGFIILMVLWSFSLLSGAGASILRSVVMFSFIVIGESITRQVSVYHTLAASAFFLLCWNPFFLWDVGFQLSYAAVLSIVVFLKPVTNWFYFRNKWVDYTWKLAAVTIAAQILTTPLGIYHFHQAPNYFLLSNLLVVPLSGIILYGEILLCVLAVVPFVANQLGYCLSFLLQCMNGFTAWVNDLPYAVSTGIMISAIQVAFLYAFIAIMAIWLMFKKTQALAPALICLLLFIFIRLADTYYKTRQTRLVVYNVPRHTAIDLFANGKFFYIGDDTVNHDRFMRNFHLLPSRIMNRSMVEGADPKQDTTFPFIWLNHKKVLLADQLNAQHGITKPDVDIIILSGKVKLSVNQLWQQFRCSSYVFDASCPGWKTNKWKNECDSLLLRRHSVAEDGAFILD